MYARMACLAVCLFVAVGCQQMDVREPQGGRVTATSPRTVTIHRGESTSLTVAIDRESFAGPVKVSLSQLPSGVTVDRASMTVDTTSATFALTATRTADRVRNQAVVVTLEDDNGRRAMQYIDLTVTE